MRETEEATLGGRDRVLEDFRRKIEDYERWFHTLDSQMRVLERERQKLAAIVHHTDAGFLVLDPQVRVVWANHVFTRRFAPASNPGAVVGERCSQVLCRNEEGCGACPVKLPFTTGSVAHFEIGLRVEGQERHIYATSMPIKSPEGSVEQTIVMLQDVSDLEVLRRSEEALRASEGRFRSIFENAATGMATMGPNGAFLQVNPAFCAFLGYEEDELRKLTVFDVTHPDDLQASRRIIAETVSGQRNVLEIEKRYVREDGAVVWGHVTASLLEDPEGRPTCAVAMVQDITDRKRLEEELRQAEKMSAMGILVSGVAHELNNPLAGVLGYTQLLQKVPVPESVRQGLESISREAERCRRVVHNLQAFARKHKPQEEPVCVNDVLESTLELRAYQLKVDNISVVKDLPSDLPRTMADFHQLQQVFLNLIINAHQAMAGAGRPGLLTVSSRRSGNGIVVEIGDDGPGVAPEYLDRIFDPFFTTKEIGQGTGLGLSICYGIIAEHNGRISARNAAGGGAVFTVELPIRSPEALREETNVPQEGAKTASALRRGSVLVVDDETTIIEILSLALSTDGHQVETALNGVAALRKMQEGRFDLVISDLKMPVMGGRELYEKVREIDPALARRFIFTTGDVIGGDAHAFLDSTGNAYLHKPFDLETILNLVRSCLEAAVS